jgi:hypothetical protein
MGCEVERLTGYVCRLLQPLTALRMGTQNPAAAMEPGTALARLLIVVNQAGGSVDA